MEKNYGHKIWLIADAYLESKFTTKPSHDCVCILNTTTKDARITLTIYRQGKPKMDGFVALCPAEQTHHIRMDYLVSQNGEKIPTDIPYAILVESDQNIVCQYSRMDTSLGNMALMTTIAYPILDK